ncbi:group III truncated hemoglobin [Olleya marilimosa]|uniref:Group III truncated hemoglobin n=1 Tax=Olleya marilimosa TaxID=272164 RepID=A0ABR8LU51_9FLAO|nr:group III truncated hemoglobin [Olleya marilimosa]MBD3863702.1 group III truncated hemoglobin [Olleya marilimosa]MBD3890866.1 group III truncated hemoglobin [Olleya marilimosa]
MKQKAITNRDDVKLLVDQFYIKVRADSVLGPIFNTIIKDWETHLDHLTTFWETSLFIGKKLEHKYVGNPLIAHEKVDATLDHTITEMHFGIWLNLWYATLDQFFEGEIADNAKRRARKMGTFMYLKIFEARQNKKD